MRRHLEQAGRRFATGQYHPGGQYCVPQQQLPAAAVAPDGGIYVTWSSQMSDATASLPDANQQRCHATVLYSKSTDDGTTWATPAVPSRHWTPPTVRLLVIRPVRSVHRACSTPRGYAVPGRQHLALGRVFLALRSGCVSPCRYAPPAAAGRANHLRHPRPYIHNARLDYVVRISPRTRPRSSARIRSIPVTGSAQFLR